MIYNINTYEFDDKCRYVLGNPQNNPLIVFGINPSIANDKNKDHTISKVMGFAEGNNFDSFIMLNIYPQISTDVKNLHLEFNPNIHLKNLEHIKKIFTRFSNSTILASWSNNISSRKYLKSCLEQIFIISKNYDFKWLHLGNLTKEGHPRHPSRTSYSVKLNNFDIEKYLKKY